MGRIRQAQNATFRRAEASLKLGLEAVHRVLEAATPVRSNAVAGRPFPVHGRDEATTMGPSVAGAAMTERADAARTTAPAAPGRVKERHQFLRLELRRGQKEGLFEAVLVHQELDAVKPRWALLTVYLRGDSAAKEDGLLSLVGAGLPKAGQQKDLLGGPGQVFDPSSLLKNAAHLLHDWSPGGLICGEDIKLARRF